MTPIVEEGEREIDLKGGSAKLRDGSSESQNSIGFGWGANSWWFTELYAIWHKEPGEPYSFDAWEWENKFQLTETGKYPVDIGFLFEIERPRDRSEGYELRFGPLLQSDLTPKLQANLNLLFEKHVDSAEPIKTELGYQWQLKYRWQPALEFGLQGLGDVGPWNHWEPHDEQPHPILSDLKVRQAIAKAIDRKAIADQLYGPTGSATCNIAVAPAQINSPNTTCERDVEGAKKLLEEAGWTDSNGNGTVDKDGKELVLSFQTTINALRQGEQAIVKENLAEIGIQVDLKAIDASVFFGGDPGNPDTLNKFYADLQMYTNSPDSPDPAYYFAGWQCEKVNSKANNWQGGNAGRYCNKDYDAAYATFAKEFDPAKRAELAIGLNDMLVNDVVIVPLINRVTPSGKAKDIVGPTYNSFDSNLWNVGTWTREQP